MSDLLVRAITSDGLVKAMALSSRDLVDRAREIHGCSPLAAVALGRTLTAASMLGASLKEERGSVTLQVRGGGPLGAITAVGDCGGGVRGYLQNPGVDLPLRPDGKLDVGAGVGREGRLTVVKDLNLREPYVGTVELRSGEIAEDVAAYFAESEQIPTACALGVLVDTDRTVRAAGGYLLQMLPGAGEDVISRLEESVSRLGPVTAALDRGLSPEELLREALRGFRVDILETQEVAYVCPCNRDRVARAVLAMGREEIKKLAREQENTEITCQFCDRKYHFGREELLKMAE